MCLSIEVLAWRLPTRSRRQFIATATIISSMGSAPDETRYRWQRSKQQASPRMVDTAQELLRRHWAVLCCAVPTLGQIAAASLSSSYLQRSNGLDTAVRSSHTPRGAIEGPEENWQSSRTSENTHTPRTSWSHLECATTPCRRHFRPISRLDCGMRAMWLPGAGRESHPDLVERPDISAYGLLDTTASLEGHIRDKAISSRLRSFLDSSQRSLEHLFSFCGVISLSYHLSH